MTLALWLEIIQGVLAFPSAVLSLVRALKGTPVSQQQAIVAAVQAQQTQFEQTGRPTWD
jgi:hypothetical protein